MNSMIDAITIANALTNDELDAAVAAEELQLMIDGEEDSSLLLTALLRVQRARIEAGRAAVRACESLEDAADILRVGDVVEHPVNRGNAGWAYYRARVVAVCSDRAEVEYRLQNGKIATASVGLYGRSSRAQ